MHEKLDYFDPAFIMAFLMAAMSDFLFIFTLGMLIPVVGIVIGAGVIVIHYSVCLPLVFLVMVRLKHFTPKLALGLAMLLPLPTLFIGIILGIAMQNRLIEFAVTQAVAIGVGALTGGAGAVAVEGASAAKTGAQAAQVATEVSQAARGAAAGIEAAESAGAAGQAESLGSRIGRRAQHKIKKYFEEFPEESGEEREDFQEETPEELESVGALGAAQLARLEQSMGKEGLAELIREAELPQTDEEEEDVELKGNHVDLRKAA